METAGQAYKVLIADDHEVIRFAIKYYVQSSLTHVSVEEAKCMDEIERKVRESVYDLIVLDLGMPGSDPQRIFKLLEEKSEKTRVLIFSGSSEEVYAVRYLRAGADGYLEKSASSREIQNALQLMIQTGRYISSDIQNKLMQQSIHGQKSAIRSIDILSAKELEVANYLSDGMSNKEICNRLSIHPSSVSTYKKRIFQKLRVTNVIELKEFLD